MKQEKARAYIDSIIETHVDAIRDTDDMDELKKAMSTAFVDAAVDIKNIVSEVYKDFIYEHNK